ncbi:hypothetical protein SLEP1_g11424 [Rubroshorea leprosula]|uniref:Uncharacterized protein n=1 Tax=Rubroshorea leprosula TaxID=152421 RepID=A0AAV5ILD5_9ROSI|nr:hypothetical protein SLEP1_g11424 [Rubroshorea leprosula]
MGEKQIFSLAEDGRQEQRPEGITPPSSLIHHFSFPSHVRKTRLLLPPPFSSYQIARFGDTSAVHFLHLTRLDQLAGRRESRGCRYAADLG